MLQNTYIRRFRKPIWTCSKPSRNISVANPQERYGFKNPIQTCQYTYADFKIQFVPPDTSLQQPIRGYSKDLR